jgi:NADP-dependent 3-hydroxy acid dehydrogenase YdfG
LIDTPETILEAQQSENLSVKRAVLITGGSSGIGRALALHYAGPDIVMGLLGRDHARLETVARDCAGKGAAVEHAAIDVRDRTAMCAWIDDFDRRHATDLVFANAGVLGGAHPGERLEPADVAHALMEANVQGVLNTVHPLLEPMMRRRKGQIALIGSLAGFNALPDAPSYCASKAAVMTYGLALREAMRGTNVRINVVCPGFVRTPMTEQLTGWTPGEIDASAAARRIANGLEKDRAIIAFPFMLAWLSRFGAVVPDWLRQVGSRPFRYKIKDES